MATRKTGNLKTSKTRAARAGIDTNSDDFRPIQAKRAALEAAERQARRKPARAAQSRGGVAQNAPGSASSRRGANNVAGNGAASKKASGKAAGKSAPPASARSKSAGKQAAGKKAAGKKTVGKKSAQRAPVQRKASAKRVSEKLWKLAEQKAAQRTSTPAWQQIEHHDGHAQVNAPSVQSARIARVKRGDRRLTPAEKQRAGE